MRVDSKGLAKLILKSQALKSNSDRTYYEAASSACEELQLDAELAEIVGFLNALAWVDVQQRARATLDKKTANAPTMGQRIRSVLSW